MTTSTKERTAGHRRHASRRSSLGQHQAGHRPDLNVGAGSVAGDSVLERVDIVEGSSTRVLEPSTPMIRALSGCRDLREWRQAKFNLIPSPAPSMPARVLLTGVTDASADRHPCQEPRVEASSLNRSASALKRCRTPSNPCWAELQHRRSRTPRRPQSRSSSREASLHQAARSGPHRRGAWRGVVPDRCPHHSRQASGQGQGQVRHSAFDCAELGPK